MEKYEIRNQSDSVNLLNDISRADRINFDTIDDELNCLYEFCPWTPDDTIKGTKLIFTYLVLNFLCAELCISIFHP